MADKMKKSQYKVVVTTKGGYTGTYDDSVTAGVGSAVNAALNAKQDIRTATDIIPFHAVDHAVITFTLAEVDKPEDPTCPSGE